MARRERAPAPAVTRPYRPYQVATPRAAVATAELARPFRVIVFDWDGTAVSSRNEDAFALIGLAGALLRLGVWLVIVAGTNVGHIDRQLGRRLPPAAKRHLLICANRGSEVYGYSRRGTPVRRWRRLATPTEDAALTATATAVHDALTRRGLATPIIADRLNRRKIDLIPLPEWADPPKSRIGELRAAVEERLHAAGVTGGLAEVGALTDRLARNHGLAEPRITSDAKHIEVGLTDKRDSAAWIARELLAVEDIAPHDVLIGGDEFGATAGFPGSDDLMRAGLAGAVAVSVGPEPAGAPAGVLHLGGGPERFRALLADQVWWHQRACRPVRETAGRIAGDWLDAALLPPAEPAWRLEETGYVPALEHEIESRLTVGNGLLGIRGSLGQATAASHPRTFVAGVFDAAPGAVPLPALAPGPDWLRFQLTLDGRPLLLAAAQPAAHPRVLDLRRGVLLSSWSQRADGGPAGRLNGLRFASHDDRALAVQVARVEVMRPAWLTLEAWLEPPPPSLEQVRQQTDAAVWRTAHGSHHLAVAAHVSLRVGDAEPEAVRDGDRIGWRWGWVATPDEPAVFSRIVAFARDGTAERGEAAARAAITRARAAGVRRLLTAQRRSWAARWQDSDVVVEGDAAAQQALRFAAYHLVSAANPDDEQVSIGARALSGDAYLGHVFWDTEIFLLPFYTFTWPEAARALLMYRYHTLPAARAKAARLGYQGALFAWESADSGEETTPPFVVRPDGEVIQVRCGTEEHHISADIAYAVWQYWRATGDIGFLRDAGAEIILETARFWASRATVEADGQAHIRNVIGPDEYHEGVDDNAFTNGMARWNLERGVEVARLLARRWPGMWAALRQRLALTDEEVAAWPGVAGRLVTGFDEATGLIEQFAGFHQLEPIDLAGYTLRTVPIDVVLGAERTRRSQVVKQADVVMLSALLWDDDPPEVHAANFFHYEPRCGHGSSLSPAMHALVAARLGDTDLAERYFHQAAEIDLSDRMGNAAGGVHIAALGGLWQAAVFGFAGLRLTPRGPRLDPHLPQLWQTLRFRLRWRGRRVQISIRQSPLTVTATLEAGRPVRLCVGGLEGRLRAGQPWSCRFDRRTDRWLEVNR